MAAVKVAVVGLGAITQSVHLPLLLRLRTEFEVVALADLSADRARFLAGRHGVPATFTSLAALLSAHAQGRLELDGVILATTGSHGEDALSCVRAGLAVLVEKPLAMSAAETDALMAHDGARLQVGYMKEYDPASTAAREHLHGRTVRAVEVEVLHPASTAQLEYARLLGPAPDLDPGALAQVLHASEQTVTRALGDQVPTRWRTLYERVVLGSVVHEISLLRYLLGGIATVQYARQWGGLGQDPGSVQAGGELVPTDHGPGQTSTDPDAAPPARWSLNWHYLPEYPDYRETVTVHHDTGSVQLVFGIPYLLNSPTVLTVVERGPAGQEIRAEHRWNQREAFENELLAFAQLAGQGSPALSGSVQARADLLVAWQFMARLGQHHGFTVGGEAGAWWAQHPVSG